MDRDLHCIMETQNINSDTAPSRAQQIVQTDDILLSDLHCMSDEYLATELLDEINRTNEARDDYI